VQPSLWLQHGGGALSVADTAKLCSKQGIQHLDWGNFIMGNSVQPSKIMAVLALIFTISACGGSTVTSNMARPTTTTGGGEIRRVPAMSIRVHKLVQKAQEQMDLKSFELASQYLDQVLSYERTNGYERAVAWQAKALIAFEQNDTPATITAYENIVKYRNTIPVALELNIIYGLSQLNYSLENYDEALRYFNEWEPKASHFLRENQLVYAAQLHYVRESFPQSLTYVDRAISLAVAKVWPKPKENWYGLKLSVHYELNQYQQAKTTLHALIENWPRMQYCQILAGLHLQIDNNLDESAAVAVVKDQFSTCKELEASAIQTTLSANHRHHAVNLAPSVDEDYLPLVRVQPQYPRAAYLEKITGEVTVELTVLADGTVDKDSIIIIEATPKGYFEQAVTKAASMFKYKPKIVNGKPMQVTGVRYKFTFDIAD
jgi:TonB family protein